MSEETPAQVAQEQSRTVKQYHRVLRPPVVSDDRKGTFDFRDENEKDEDSLKETLSHLHEMELRLRTERPRERTEILVNEGMIVRSWERFYKAASLRNFVMHNQAHHDALVAEMLKPENVKLYMTLDFDDRTLLWDSLRQKLGIQLESTDDMKEELKNELTPFTEEEVQRKLSAPWYKLGKMMVVLGMASRDDVQRTAKRWEKYYPDMNETHFDQEGCQGALHAMAEPVMQYAFDHFGEEFRNASNLVEQRRIMKQAMEERNEERRIRRSLAH